VVENKQQFLNRAILESELCGERRGCKGSLEYLHEFVCTCLLSINASKINFMIFKRTGPIPILLDVVLYKPTASTSGRGLVFGNHSGSKSEFENTVCHLRMQVDERPWSSEQCLSIFCLSKFRFYCIIP